MKKSPFSLQWCIEHLLDNFFSFPTNFCTIWVPSVTQLSPLPLPLYYSYCPNPRRPPLAVSILWPGCLQHCHPPRRSVGGPHRLWPWPPPRRRTVAASRPWCPCARECSTTIWPTIARERRPGMRVPWRPTRISSGPTARRGRLSSFVAPWNRSVDPRTSDSCRPVVAFARVRC